MGRTVGELETSMSSSEYSHWLAFYQLYPFGPERDNLHAAIIAATVANVHRGKQQTPFTPDSFMLKTGDDRPNKGFDELVAFLNANAVEKNNG